MTNVLAKSRHAWSRAVLNDPDLFPATRIVGLAMASNASTRSNQLILALRPELRSRLALTDAEGAEGLAELLSAGYLSRLPELRCDPGERAVLTFPPGVPIGRGRDLA